MNWIFWLSFQICHLIKQWAFRICIDSQSSEPDLAISSVLIVSYDDLTSNFMVSKKSKSDLGFDQIVAIFCNKFQQDSSSAKLTSFQASKNIINHHKTAQICSRSFQFSLSFHVQATDFTSSKPQS